MNKYQRFTVITGACIVLIMLFFPPFHVHIDRGIFHNMGYAFILNPPEYEDFIMASVNGRILLVQWIGILLLTAMAFFALKASEGSD
jgi:hypothetical protein